MAYWGQVTSFSEKGFMRLNEASLGARQIVSDSVSPESHGRGFVRNISYGWRHATPVRIPRPNVAASTATKGPAASPSGRPPPPPPPMPMVFV